MVTRGNGGSIVMISSLAAHRSNSRLNISAYSASKGAVKSLGHALATELGPYGIRVNTISPGFVVRLVLMKASDSLVDIS